MKLFKFAFAVILLLSVTAALVAKSDVELVSSTADETVLKFKITSYDFKKVKTPTGEAVELVIPNSAKNLQKGAPDVPKLSASVLIPDRAKMKVEVGDFDFIEIPNVNIAPSKGNLTRNINPQEVPYVYGKEYETDAFYPAQLVQLGNPYIIRDFRGQAVTVNPFRYNPVSKVLRVYKEIIVKISDTGHKGENPLVRQRALDKIYPEFKNVYSRHYINYAPVRERYTPVGDALGSMLIVCYSSFMDEMAAFVSWKESIGYNVDLVDYSTIGSSAALKSYVTNYYNSNGLTFLLLVGDHAQVPTSSTAAGDSDNNYGYILGSDHYLDIFVGRFSAETAAHVTTQVQRTIHYERDLVSSAPWFRKAVGMGSAEGPGHSGEYDYRHIDNILSDCSSYGYTTYTNHQSGGSTANLTNLVNNGAGVMFYCGHGSETAWTCGWNFSTANVNALTNDYKLPFIFSVACVIGDFKNRTCFCESWLRATNNGNPTGAVAHCGSTINQDWEPPMDAQDEMADILTTAGKRTFGGVFVNGMFKMIDMNGTSGQNMADTWTCFGDPSLQLRTPGTPNGPGPVTTGSVTVTSPNGGENWVSGSTRNITWTSSGISGDVKITLLRNGDTVGVITAAVSAASGSYSWTVGRHLVGTVTPGTGYTIKIKEKDTAVVDLSDASFDIVASTQPTLTVTSPNGGEVWVSGSSRNITWTSSGISGDVKIILLQNGVSIGVITTAVSAAAGSYSWTVGRHLGGTATPGTGYTIKIRSKDMAISDTGDAPFDIVSSTQPTLTVTSPNGGEDWVSGSSRNITWTSSGISGDVKIILLQNGVSIGVITTAVNAAAGFYSWTVGRHLDGFISAGSGYTIKIRSKDMAISDTGDAPFDIVSSTQTTLTVASPNGGEDWLSGSTRNITWTSSGVSGDVKIILLRNGVSIGVITTAVSAAAGSYSWTVGRHLGGTATPGTGYSIKIRSKDMAIADTGDAAFEISPGAGGASWTFMVYLDGDNNLEEAGIDDFLEMSAAGSTADVNIVAQFDRIAGYDSSYGNWTGTKRFYITPGLTPDAANAVQDLGEVNMADPAVLSGFVNWAKANYPATNYALILWNHGDGWRRSGEKPVRAICWDDTSGGDCLYTAEIRSALDAVAGVQLIGFDACLMGMVEVAYEIKDYGQVMVASEEVEPWNGWPYDTVLGDLTAHPAWTAEQLGFAIVERYNESYWSGETQAAIDLTNMGTLAAAIDAFAQSMINNWNSNHTAVKTAAQNVITAINNTVINEKHGSWWPGAHGLAIYFPDTAAWFDPDYDGTIISFAADTHWEDFLQVFYSSMAGSWIDNARYFSQEFYYYEHIDLYDFCQQLQ
ncbi:MAG: hypothetical protein KAW12_10010 [Candidatus Aminicenantes bacterium]|nr:hypothetical protein [Candidatus Aminicenantes bacterium]